MVRTNGVGVFPVNNAIGTIVQAVERSDVDTVMVAGAMFSAFAGIYFWRRGRKDLSC